MKSRVRTTLTAALTVAAAMASGIAWLAPAASAATVSVTLNCDREVALLADPGDTIVFSLGTGCPADWFFANINGTFGRTATQSGYVEFVSTTPDFGFVPNYNYANDWYIAQSVDPNRVITTRLLTVDGNGAPLAPGVTIADVDNDIRGSAFGVVWAGPRPKDNPPPSWYQSYARATAETPCDAGWSASWAQWPNEGKGGYVCDREQYYDVNNGEWQYR